MIHIDVPEPVTDDWKEWRKRCKKEQAKYSKAIESSKPAKINESLYKGQKHDFYMKPAGPFRGKCAYCEQEIFRNQHGDVEHFRPKARVKGSNKKPVTIKVNGTVRQHLGYYWLVYDWRNLLPSCELCNEPSTKHSEGRSIGKHDQFPVNGFRASKPGHEVYEKPLLLHPVIDDPSEHLEMDATGIYHPKDGSVRGSTCINIFGLNDRNLPDARKRQYETVVQKMQLLSHAAARDANSAETNHLLNDLSGLQNGYGEFTSVVHRAIIDSEKGVRATFKKIGAL